MSSVNPVAGYPLEQFLNQEEAKKYTCPICGDVLKDPVQVNISEPKLACRSCYTDNLR